MTPNRIAEIFSTRGYQAAHEVAAACREPRLQSLVERLEKERRSASLRPGKSARDRELGATARYAANKAARAAENRRRAHGGSNKGKKAA